MAVTSEKNTALHEKDAIISQLQGELVDWPSDHVAVRGSPTARSSPTMAASSSMSHSYSNSLSSLDLRSGGGGGGGGTSASVPSFPVSGGQSGGLMLSGDGHDGQVNRPRTSHVSSRHMSWRVGAQAAAEFGVAPYVVAHLAQTSPKEGRRGLEFKDDDDEDDEVCWSAHEDGFRVDQGSRVEQGFRVSELDRAGMNPLSLCTPPTRSLQRFESSQSSSVAGLVGLGVGMDRGTASLSRRLQSLTESALNGTAVGREVGKFFAEDSSPRGVRSYGTPQFRSGDDARAYLPPADTLPSQSPFVRKSELSSGSALSGTAQPPVLSSNYSETLLEKELNSEKQTRSSTDTPSERRRQQNLQPGVLGAEDGQQQDTKHSDAFQVTRKDLDHYSCKESQREDTCALHSQPPTTHSTTSMTSTTHPGVERESGFTGEGPVSRTTQSLPAVTSKHTASLVAPHTVSQAAPILFSDRKKVASAPEALRERDVLARDMGHSSLADWGEMEYDAGREGHVREGRDRRETSGAFDSFRPSVPRKLRGTVIASRPSAVLPQVLDPYETDIYQPRRVATYTKPKRQHSSAASRPMTAMTGRKQVSKQGGGQPQLTEEYLVHKELFESELFRVALSDVAET